MSIRWTIEDIERLKAKGTIKGFQDISGRDLGNTAKTSSKTDVLNGKEVEENLVKLPKPSKYHNEKTVVDGKTFDSKKEAARYGSLKMMERNRNIKNLRSQVPYRLQVNEVLICTYIADFVYEEEGREVVEDVKGMRTKEYVLKRKLMLALKGIKIKEV